MHLRANCGSNTLYCEKGVNAQNCTHYFYLFSGASNFSSFQSTYLKFAEYVDISVQNNIKNDGAKDNGYTGCTKMEKNIF